MNKIQTMRFKVAKKYLKFGKIETVEGQAFEYEGENLVEGLILYTIDADEAVEVVADGTYVTANETIVVTNGVISSITPIEVIEAVIEMEEEIPTPEEVIEVIEEAEETDEPLIATLAEIILPLVEAVNELQTEFSDVVAEFRKTQKMSTAKPAKTEIKDTNIVQTGNKKIDDLMKIMNSK